MVPQKKISVLSRDWSPLQIFDLVPGLTKVVKTNLIGLLRKIVTKSLILYYVALFATYEIEVRNLNFHFIT